MLRELGGVRRLALLLEERVLEDLPGAKSFKLPVVRAERPDVADFDISGLLQTFKDAVKGLSGLLVSVERLGLQELGEEVWQDEFFLLDAALGSRRLSFA